MSNGPKKEDRRVRRTKKLLAQALMELLQQKQVNEITVKELTDLADMNRGTFYLYYRDIFDMMEKTEAEMFSRLNNIAAQHENDDVKHHAQPLLLDLFSFIRENQEMCRVLLSPHGDMNFLHGLYEFIYEKTRRFWVGDSARADGEDFDYRFCFVIFGCAGLIRSWVTRNCPESDAHMAFLADAMIRQGIPSD